MLRTKFIYQLNLLDFIKFWFLSRKPPDPHRPEDCFKTVRENNQDKKILKVEVSKTIL